jgi:quercetin dioxygenase-like cupin family protein
MSYPDPRYLGNDGEISAIFRPMNEPDLKIGSRVVAHYLATGNLTQGRYGLYRWELQPNTPAAQAHFHRTMSESFFILSGKVRLFNGERWIDAIPGDFLYVPEGGLHGFTNESDEPAAMLILFAPGLPREGYFQALAEIASGGQVSEEEFAEICIRYDNYFVDPKSQALYKKLSQQ